MSSIAIIITAGHGARDDEMEAIGKLMKEKIVPKICGALSVCLVTDCVSDMQLSRQNICDHEFQISDDANYVQCIIEGCSERFRLEV